MYYLNLAIVVVICLLLLLITGCTANAPFRTTLNQRQLV
jgi:hypothetical protein